LNFQLNKNNLQDFYKNWGALLVIVRKCLVCLFVYLDEFWMYMNGFWMNVWVIKKKW
jgi:hypothetical protein